MSYRPTGTVYGVLMNFKAELDALGDAVFAAPYKAPPQAPVLFIKTANTWVASGGQTAMPDGATQLEVGASIGMVMGAAGQVAGYVLMNDLSIPHTSFFRPPVKLKCTDGLLGMGPTVTADAKLLDWQLQVWVNGALRQSADFSQLVRGPQQLVADVSDFMQLCEGDVLMLGSAPGRPVASAGDHIRITAGGLAALDHYLVEAAV